MKKHIICAVLGISATVAHAQAADKPVFTCQTDEFVGKIYADPKKQNTFTYKQWFIPSDNWIQENGGRKTQDILIENHAVAMSGGRALGAGRGHCRGYSYVFIAPSGNTAFIFTKSDQYGCQSLESYFPEYGGLEIRLLESKTQMTEDTELGDVITLNRFPIHCKKPEY